MIGIQTSRSTAKRFSFQKITYNQRKDFQKVIDDDAYSAESEPLNHIPFVSKALMPETKMQGMRFVAADRTSVFFSAGDRSLVMEKRQSSRPFEGFIGCLFLLPLFIKSGHPIIYFH
jgi:hypothetical protein